MTSARSTTPPGLVSASSATTATSQTATTRTGWRVTAWARRLITSPLWVASGVERGCGHAGEQGAHRLGERDDALVEQPRGDRGEIDAGRHQFVALLRRASLECVDPERVVVRAEHGHPKDARV